jgi:hypothetical protein
VLLFWWYQHQCCLIQREDFGPRKQDAVAPHENNKNRLNRFKRSKLHRTQPTLVSANGIGSREATTGRDGNENHEEI